VFIDVTGRFWVCLHNNYDLHVVVFNAKARLVYGKVVFCIVQNTTLLATATRNSSQRTKLQQMPPPPLHSRLSFRAHLARHVICRFASSWLYVFSAHCIPSYYFSLPFEISLCYTGPCNAIIKWTYLICVLITRTLICVSGKFALETTLSLYAPIRYNIHITFPK
jgi:hypothetical protein